MHTKSIYPYLCAHRLQSVQNRYNADEWTTNNNQDNLPNKNQTWGQFRNIVIAILYSASHAPIEWLEPKPLPSHPCYHKIESGIIRVKTTVVWGKCWNATELHRFVMQMDFICKLFIERALHCTLYTWWPNVRMQAVPIRLTQFDQTRMNLEHFCWSILSIRQCARTCS